MTYYTRTVSGGGGSETQWLTSIYKQGADSPDPSNRSENTYVCEYARHQSSPSTWQPNTGVEVGPYSNTWIYSYKNPWHVDGLTLNRLYSRAAEQIRGHDFNAGLMLAEGRESLGTVVSAFRFLGQAYKAARRGNAAGFTRAIRNWSTGRNQSLGRPVRTLDIPSAHLNFTYALSPLIADLSNAWDAFTRHVETNTKFVVRSGFTERGDIGNGPSGYYPPLGYMLTTTKVRLQLIVKVTQSLSQSDSYGLTDWKSIVWEKVPFSFVVDWAIPIGNYLSNLHLFRALGYTYVQTVHYKRTEHYVRLRSEHPYAAWMYIGSGSSCDDAAAYFGEYGRIDRTHGSDLPVPFPGVKTFGQIASPQHVVNAAALVWSILGSMR